MAKTIAIATHKGGTGKTVTAMALGAGFARAGKKTLLIDLDPLRKLRSNATRLLRRTVRVSAQANNPFYTHP